MEINIDRIADQIRELCLIPSPTGFTGTITDHLIALFEDMGYHPVKTQKGAVRVCLGGEGNPLLLSAHIDTLGAMVRAIKPNGRLRLTKLGGYPENNIEGENCVVHTRTGKIYSGTIQLIHSSTHVYRDINKMERNDANVEVILDECVSSKEEVKKLGISAGDIISLDPRTVITESGFIKSRHLDDKASAAILIELARIIKEDAIELDRRVDIFFTNYEEVGHGASAGIPEDITEMIAVDMGCVGDDLEADELVVSICAKDSSGPYDYDLTTALINVAKENELDYAVDIYPYYGSDAGAALRSGMDAKFALIGPGVASSHGYERTHKNGVENTLKIILGYIIK
ncbi:MAG TPA: M42 family metallopeptidase [Thermotogota bacterium]|nr:M42 family metallopeptidase [Thermotogota bacterium]HPJ89340.1 M42 family metallopeptidase [Thermotogota bacterium]HPR96514.1 M42 family metallopeptidase [Thermotogota bacterium]